MKVAVISLILFATHAFADTLEKLPLKLAIIGIPKTSIDFLSDSFSTQALPGWGLVLTTTALTYHYDPDILDGTQRTGRNWGLVNEDHTKTVWKIGQYDILRLPSDKASTLYFLGDGWLDILTTGTFFCDRRHP